MNLFFKDAIKSITHISFEIKINKKKKIKKRKKKITKTNHIKKKNTLNYLFGLFRKG